MHGLYRIIKSQLHIYIYLLFKRLTQWLTILQFNKSNNNFFIAKSLGNKKVVVMDYLS